MAYILLAGGIGLVNAFDGPGRQSFIAEMVGREDLPNPSPLNSLMGNGARVIGPAWGILLPLSARHGALRSTGISFLAVIVGLWPMQVKPHQPLHFMEISMEAINQRHSICF